MSESKKLADDGADDGLLIGKLRKRPLAGIFLATVSGLVFGTASFCVSLLHDVDPFIVLISRALIQLTAFTPGVIFSASSIFGARGERLTLYLNGVVGAIAVCTSYFAFQLMPLGDATTIIQSMLIWATIFACVFLKETCRPFQVVIVMIAFVGVILVSRPTFAMGDRTVVLENSWGSETVSNTSLESFSDGQGDMVSTGGGAIYALIASLGLGVSFNLLRKLQKTPAGVTIIWVSFMSLVLAVTLLSSQYVISPKEIPWRGSFSSKEWLLLLANGVCGVFAQLTLTVALKIEGASLTSIGRSSDIVIAYVYQVLFLSQPLNVSSMIGATLVTVCVIASGLDKLRQSRLEQDNEGPEYYSEKVPSESQIISTAGDDRPANYSSTISV
ncbi:Solute carrier family 35 member G1 [Halotydeus destructor]|nr:Solute carrier family 35 member G1 [Halotydeus destructor]